MDVVAPPGPICFLSVKNHSSPPVLPCLLWDVVEMEDGGKQEQTYIKDSKFCLKKITANPDNVKREGRDKDKPELNKKQRR